MKYRDTYRIVTQVSRYVSHRDFRYRATPIHSDVTWTSLFQVSPPIFVLPLYSMLASRKQAKVELCFEKLFRLGAIFFLSNVFKDGV